MTLKLDTFANLRVYSILPVFFLTTKPFWQRQQDRFASRRFSIKRSMDINFYFLIDSNHLNSNLAMDDLDSIHGCFITLPDEDESATRTAGLPV